MKLAILSISSGHIDRGVEVWVEEMAKRLNKHGHDVTVFQAGLETSSEYQTQIITNIPFTPHQSSRWNLWYHFCVLLFTLRCLPYLWKDRYDWIIPINGYSQVLLCRIIRWLQGGKLMIVGHAGVGRDDHFNISLGKPDVFVALTQRAYEWAKTIGRNVVHIPNGVDTSMFHPNGPEAAISLNGPIVLCVSALVPYKRIELLIAAVAKTNASLLLIGDGSERESIVSLGKRLLGGRFIHIASVPHKDMPSYYRAADVFSLPSRESEAFGLVYLEAMACNVPVVAPDDENRRGIIGDAGILCPVEDKNAYAEALVKSIVGKWNDIPRIQAEKYSWERIGQQYELLFTASQK